MLYSGLQASLDLAANEDAKRATGVTVESKHEHFLAGFPKVDDFSYCCIDLGVCRPSALHKDAIEFASSTRPPAKDPVSTPLIHLVRLSRCHDSSA